MSDSRRLGDPTSHQPGHDFSFSYRVPQGDSRDRLVCDRCDWVHYVNPVIIVGSVVTRGDEVLLCRRAIEPRRGYWTIPAGFLEEGESSEEGARREAMEEASAEIELDAILAVYDIPRISQVQIMFRGTLVSDDVHPGPESEVVELFPFEHIPWDDLAFPSVGWALEHHRRVVGVRSFPPFRTPETFDPRP